MKVFYYHLLIATSPNLLVFSLVELLSLYMTYAFFFSFSEKEVSQFYWTKSDWNTTSKSLSRDSTHISVSADKTALLAKEWANRFPSWWRCLNSQNRWRCLNSQNRKVALNLLHSSVIWPNNVLLLPISSRTVMTLEPSPSTSALNKLSSLANKIARRAAMASANSMEWTRGIRWLKAEIIWPIWSQKTTPIPAQPEASKKATSKLPL